MQSFCIIPNGFYANSFQAQAGTILDKGKFIPGALLSVTLDEIIAVGAREKDAKKYFPSYVFHLLAGPQMQSTRS
jgi:hypothetical protein